MGSLSSAGNLGLGLMGDEVFSFSSLFSFGNDFFVSVFSRASRPERIVPLASVVSGLLCGGSAFGISTGVSPRAGSRFVSLRPLRTSGTSGVTSTGASGESETEWQHQQQLQQQQDQAQLQAQLPQPPQEKQKSAKQKQ